MNKKRRLPFVITGVLVPGLSASAVLLAQSRQEQMQADAAGTPCF